MLADGTTLRRAHRPRLLTVGEPASAIATVEEAATFIGGFVLDDPAQAAFLTGLLDTAQDLMDGPENTVTGGNTFRPRALTVRTPEGAKGYVRLPGGAVDVTTMRITNGAQLAEGTDYAVVQGTRYEFYVRLAEAEQVDIAYTAGLGPIPPVIKHTVLSVVEKLSNPSVSLLDPTFNINAIIGEGEQFLAPYVIPDFLR